MYIVGQGAVTAVGHDAARTVASLRSGLDGMVQLAFAGESGNDLRAVPVRGFGEGLGIPGRYESLAIAALRPCIEVLRAHQPKQPVVFLGLPRADRPGVPAGLAAVLQARLEREFDLPRGSVRTIEEGRVSIFMALAHAQTALQGTADACIVGGVDCLVDPRSLIELSKAGRIAEEYDGFFPGEGASFVCLSTRGERGLWGKRAARVASFGMARENADGSAEQPLLGTAVREALREATGKAGLAESDLGVYINAVNGTRSEFEDDAFAQAKFFLSPRDYLEIWHLASCVGETGAAYGALALIWAAAAAELGFSMRKATLVSATEGPWRAAACVVAGRASNSGGVGLSHLAPVFHQRAVAGPSIPAEDDPGIRLADDDLHAELATRNVEELAALLLIRDGHLQDASPWADIEGFEQRMLTHFDAVAWHGAALGDKAQELAEGGEPEDAAAATMVLCGGSSGPEQVDWLVEQCAESEDHLRMIVDTAALMPKSVAHKLLLRLADVDEAHELAALRGLSQAGWIDAAFAAKRAKVVTPGGRAPLICAIGRGALPDLQREVDALLRAPDKLRDPLAWLAAMAVLPESHVQTLLGAEDGLDFAPETLAATCTKLGQSLFKAVEKRTPTPSMLVALGHSGEVRAADLLLTALASEDEAVRIAAAAALDRTFGCALLDEEVVEDEDAEEGEDEETIEVLSQDPERWRAAIHPLRATTSRRLRRGQPLVPESPLQDLVLERASYREREISALEYAALTGKPAPVHPRQLVAQQRTRLPPIG